MKKQNIKKYILSIILAAFAFIVLITPSASLAAQFDVTKGRCEGGIIEYLKYISDKAGKGEIKESGLIFNSIACAMDIFEDALLLWVSILAAFYIAMSGVNYILATGNEAKTKEAVKKLQAAVIGYLVFLSVFVLIDFVKVFIQYDQQVAKFKQINIDISPKTQ